MTTYPIRTRRWTRREYERLVDLGLLDDEPIELLGGHLIVAEPKSSPHATAIRRAARALERAFGAGWLVLRQDPIALDDESEPEPDVAVVRGDIDDFRDFHPDQPALVVEVGRSSLVFDRRYKGSLYARAGVADYWIVNLVDEVVEVRRWPIADPDAEFGASYADLSVWRRGDAIAPLVRADTLVAVADLLP